MTNETLSAATFLNRDRRASGPAKYELNLASQHENVKSMCVGM
jgi:hypothetical protein